MEFTVPVNRFLHRAAEIRQAGCDRGEKTPAAFLLVLRSHLDKNPIRSRRRRRRLERAIDRLSDCEKWISPEEENEENLDRDGDREIV